MSESVQKQRKKTMIEQCNPICIYVYKFIHRKYSCLYPPLFSVMLTPVKDWDCPDCADGATCDICGATVADGDADASDSVLCDDCRTPKVY